MGLIPPDTLEAIRTRLDITDVARDFIPDMSRAGRHWKARCPFHQEKTPSFIISPERQTFHCFGCGEGGDVFTLVMKIEGLSFGEAVEKLAARAGVRIERNEAQTPRDRERLKVREALLFARDFYHSQLLKSAAAAPARDYLKGRGLNKELCVAFGLGYATGASRSLITAAAAKGYKTELLVKAGLVSSRDGRTRDYFFNRILFPIFDAKGTVVGFGARGLGDAMPKYLNSPDSDVFSKSRVLYGLNMALPQVRKKRKALLMEGYMDVIAAHQFGFTTACAPLGTALTVEHAGILRRYASDVVIVFDADNAGSVAAIRGAGILMEAGLGVRIATVVDGKDPDELLHKSGAEPFEECLKSAVDIAEFRTETALAKRPRPLSPADKSSVAREILETIAQCPDEVLKGEWVRRLAQRIDVDESSLRRQLEKGGALPRHRARPVPGGKSAALGQADKDILALLFKKPALAVTLVPEDLDSATAKRVVESLAGSGETVVWGDFLNSLSEEDRPAVSKILTEDVQFDEPEGILKGLLDKRRRVARFKELEPKILKMGAEEPVDEKLKEEYMRLLVELKGSRR